jgi:hypothetical protein
MTDHVISRDLIRSKGAAAYRAGQGRDEHNMNPGSAAIEDWQAGWDQEQQRETVGGSCA